MENGERVRLIGVDTAGTRHLEKPVEYYGKQDTSFIQGMVQGKRMRLEFDGIRRKDRLGRTWLMFFGYRLLLNAEIIKQGYGFTYTLMPFTRMAEFRRLEREAKEQRRGFWKYL
jgi:micrococcal nuclease